MSSQHEGGLIATVDEWCHHHNRYVGAPWHHHHWWQHLPSSLFWLSYQPLCNYRDRRLRDLPARYGFFFWGPDHTDFWIRPIRGHDEYRHATVGIMTRIGSIFWAWPCKGGECCQ